MATKLQRLQTRLGSSATGKDDLLAELLLGAEEGIKSSLQAFNLTAGSRHVDYKDRGDRF